jgi:hypothetical protein
MRATCLLTLSLCLLGPMAVCPAPAAHADVGELSAQTLAQLDSDDADVRERATRNLLLSPASLDAIEQALAQPDLSLEQRARLWEVGLSRFEATPRGAMGISFGTGPGPVVVNSLEGDFPSHRVLQRGDELLSIDGVQLLPRRVQEVNLRDIRPLIISRDPGESCEVVVRRRGATLTLQVPLGSFSNLMSNNLDQTDYRLGFAARLARRVPSLRPRAEVEAHAPERAQAPGEGAQMPGAGLAWDDRAGEPAGDEARVVAGGAARKGQRGRASVAQMDGDGFGAQVRRLPDGGVIVRMNPRDGQLLPRRMEAMNRLTQLQMQLFTVRDMLARQQKALQDPQTSPEAKARAQQVIDNLRERQKALELEYQGALQKPQNILQGEP